MFFEWLDQMIGEHMPRPAIMPKELRIEAQAILDKHRIEFDGHFFSKPKPNPLYSWDSHWKFSFFSSPDRLNGCCGVIEFHDVFNPSPNFFPNDLSEDEWATLFNYNVRKVLQNHFRRMGLITLINSQKQQSMYAVKAGFEKVSEGYNPGTRHKVSVWALSI